MRENKIKELLKLYQEDCIANEKSRLKLLEILGDSFDVENWFYTKYSKGNKRKIFC